MKFSYFLLAIIFLCLFSACRYNSEKSIDIGDGGFLSGESCSLPCFKQIVPGKTDEDQAAQILRDNQYLSNCIFNKESSESDTHGIVCYERIVIGIRNDNSLVEDVGFRPSINITLQQVIEKYGNPDKVAIYVHEYPDWITLSLFYENILTVLDLDPQDGMVYKLKPSSVITNIAYSESNAFRELESQSQAQSWEGFGEYPKSQH